MKPLYYLTYVLLLLLSNNSYTQISFEGEPYYAHKKSAVTLPFIDMPALDNAMLDGVNKQNSASFKNLRFAYPFSVNISPENEGVWETVEDGTKIWRVGIRSSKAKSLNLIFTTFKLSEGCKMFIYSPSISIVYGAYNYRTNPSTTSLATSPVPGDETIIELQVPKDVSDYGVLEIGQVAHDFLGIFEYINTKDGNYGRSGDCNIDINCDAGANWQNEKKAVARLIIRGYQLCTGTMVNNSRNDGTPYFLTANHCIKDSIDAYNTVFCFDYESPYCNGPDGSIAHGISGSKLKATSPNLDFTLVELINKPPYTFDLYYAGWSYDETAPDSSATIHHPLGDVKKISFDHDSPVTSSYPNEFDQNAFWKILSWERGTTEGGSSGSPLFNQNHQIIGTLTGGDASCGNSVNDYYAKLARSWDDYPEKEKQLKYWLDPDNTGLKNVNAYIPGATPDFTAGISKSTSEIRIFDTVNFTDASIGDIALYKWDFGTDAIPRYAFTKGPHKVLYVTAGNKTINLEILNGNKSSIASEQLTALPTDIDELIFLPYVAFPNPSDGWVYIEVPDSQPNYRLTVFNILGQQQQPTISFLEQRYNIDFTGFSKGLYIIKMQDIAANNKIRRLTVVIQ
ncbi:MAG: T9SS type A sorting domain-containing protein [Bacteroidales bacterium]|nr:T9SS type A sorting domain-containing protein [Bacteroidales bacterium]